MKISEIIATEVIVPAHPGVVNSQAVDKPLHKLASGGKQAWSKQFDEMPKCILQVKTDTRLVGLGELYRDHDWRTVENVARTLIGMDLSEICLQKLPAAKCREYDGFECAIWDLFAKSKNMSIADLLGGAVRDKIWVSAWSGHRTVADLAELASDYQARGYTCLKFKCDLEDDVVGWCREIKKAAPEMKVILDPNERWATRAEAQKRINELEKIGNVLCLEDPIPQWQLDDFATLRTQSSIPIALHVSLPYSAHGQKISNAVQAVRHNAVDGFNFNCGISEFQMLGHLADAAQLPYWHGSEVDLGILEALYLHKCASAPGCTWPSDVFGRLIREHDLLEEPIEMDLPYAKLPSNGPGLGVLLSEDALQKFKQDQRTFN